MRRLVWCALTGALGVWLALSLSRAAVGCMTELRRSEALRQELECVIRETEELEQAVPKGDKQIRIWLFRQKGLAAPEDTVFFDGG